MATTYNPIIRREPISFWDSIGARMTPEPGQALVLVGHESPLVTLWFGQRLTARDAMRRALHHMYRIDVSAHTLAFDCKLPCASDAFDFHAEAWFTCWVADPKVIIENMITDARAVLEPLLIQIMRSVSRKRGMKDCAQAEQEIAEAVLQQQPKQGSFEITHFVVNLEMEAEERTHARQMRHLERATELTLKEIEWKRHYSELVTELDQRSIDFYNKLIATDNGQLLLLELARNPQNVHIVLQSLNEHLQSDRDYWLKAFNALREADALEAFDLEKARDEVIRHFAELDKKIRAQGGLNGSQAPMPQPVSQAAGATATNGTQATGATAANATQAVTATAPTQTQVAGAVTPGGTQVVGTTAADQTQVAGAAGPGQTQVAGATPVQNQVAGATPAAQTQVAGAAGPGQTQVVGATPVQNQVAGASEPDKARAVGGTGPGT